MALPESYDDERVRLLLNGDPSQIKEGLEYIRATLEDTCAGYIRQRFPWLKGLELADVWHDGLLATLEAAGKKSIPLNRKFWPWLWVTLRNRAFLRLRWTKSDKKKADAKTEEYEEYLKGTKLAEDFDISSEEEQKRKFDLIRKVLDTLEGRQYEVLGVWLKHYPNIESDKDLWRQVKEETGEELSFATVRRAKQEVIRKVREAETGVRKQ